MKCEVYIQNNGKLYKPLIEGEITWETELRGVPGKLCFNVVKDYVINFQEGNPVIFKAYGKEVFYGFVFAKERDKEGIIKVTAYDQLRYLKNKDTYVYKNKKASDVVKMIASDFYLQTGIVADTGHVIAQRVEDNKTLFDIILNALDLTLVGKKKLYVLYDEFGKLTLQDAEQMKLPGDLIVGDNRAQNFSYKTDIDIDTYNKIKLVKDNKKSGKRDVYITQDSKNIHAWGVLQYYEKINDNSKTDIKSKAEALLSLRNKKGRSLQVKDNIGDIRVRAGTSVLILLEDIGDISVKQYMLIEKCKHAFKNDEHFMTLSLRGDI